jgi:ATP-binding cassette subfamily C (CFTR/MRP) protein 4
MLAKPKVLFLDEATSAVDGETDALIQKMLRSKFVGTTLITIAHRLNTVMDYDCILVMSEGKAAEFGTPAELLSNKNGLFSELVESTGKESSASLRSIVFGS